MKYSKLFLTVSATLIMTLSQMTGFIPAAGMINENTVAGAAAAAKIEVAAVAEEAPQAPAAEEVIAEAETKAELTEIAAVTAPQAGSSAQKAAPEVKSAKAEFGTEEYTEKVLSEISKRNSYGRVVIPDAKIDVALFLTKDLTKLQKVVDAKDSAAMFNWGGDMLIADHSHQGFGNLRKSVKTGTKAYIVSAEGTKTYTCKEVIKNGWNEGSYLGYNNHDEVRVKSNEIVMYTCNADGTGTITITIWSLSK